jgi:hypothetical protein
VQGGAPPVLPRLPCPGLPAGAQVRIPSCR